MSKLRVCGCEANHELKYYAENGRQVAYSLEESEACSRNFCQQCYAWTVPVRDAESKAELLTVSRPWSCPLLPLKCCCYQSATASSGGRQIGLVRENWLGCIPSFSIYNDRQEHVQLVRLHVLPGYVRGLLRQRVIRARQGPAVESPSGSTPPATLLPTEPWHRTAWER